MIRLTEAAAITILTLQLVSSVAEMVGWFW